MTQTETYMEPMTTLKRLADRAFAAATTLCFAVLATLSISACTGGLERGEQGDDPRSVDPFLPGGEIVIGGVLPTQLPIYVTATPDQTEPSTKAGMAAAGSDVAPITRTMISDGRVKWVEGDTFSMLGVGTATEYVTDPAVRPLSLEELDAMAPETEKTVMVVALSYNGYKLASSGSTWSCASNEVPGYARYGAGLTDSQYAANEEQMAGELTELLGGSDAAKYKFTLHRNAVGFSFSNCDGKYWSYSNGMALSDEGSEFTFEHATGTASTSAVMKQNTGEAVVNPCVLHIKTEVRSGRRAGTFYLQSGNGPTLVTSTTSGWTLFYVYEVNPNPQTREYEYKFPFNSEFRITDAENEKFFGTILDGSGLIMAVYPYSSGNNFNGTDLTLKLPNKQKYAPDSFGQKAFPMVGHLKDDGDVSFRNICGVMKFSITGTATVRSIMLEDLDPDAQLWGTVTMKAADILDGFLDTPLKGGDNSVVLDCADGVTLDPSVATNFYISVPAGVFSTGFTVTLDTSDGTLYRTARADNTIKRSVVKAMPLLDQGNFLRK